jgi:hypothetical protein
VSARPERKLVEKCDSRITPLATIGLDADVGHHGVRHISPYRFFLAMTCAATGRLSPPRRHRLRLQRGARHARWPNRYQRGSCAVVRPSYGGSYGYRCRQSNSAGAASFCFIIKGWRYGSGYAADA